MNNLQTAVASNQQVESVGLLDSIIEQSRIARNADEQIRAKSLIGELAKEVMAGQLLFLRI